MTESIIEFYSVSKCEIEQMCNFVMALQQFTVTSALLMAWVELTFSPQRNENKKAPAWYKTSGCQQQGSVIIGLPTGTASSFCSTQDHSHD